MIRAPRLAALVGCVVLALLAGCATRPPVDGPSDRPPAELSQLPDPTPRVEPLRQGGPNKPYEVLGVRYQPMSWDGELRELGLASWYGRAFHGRPTANGETFDMHALTAAHKTMPLPSYARVRNPANGAEIVVRVNDRGPFVAGRVIDLSYAAAAKLGVLAGVTPVEVERLTHSMIRAGLGRSEPALAVTEPAPIAAAPADGSAPGFWIQLGAFRERDGAEQLQRLVQREADWLAPLLAVIDQAPWFRLRAGPWGSRTEAETMARRLADALPLDAFVLALP